MSLELLMAIYLPPIVLVSQVKLFSRIIGEITLVLLGQLVGSKGI
jgi:uncharacterized membrane protein YqaE (UPF0057 family)